jgi:predicted HTH transcriptional regulator
MNASKMSTNWTPDKIAAYISQGKGESLDWFPEGVSVTNLAATLVGMANTSGGMLLIGVAPRSGVVQGVSDVSRAQDLIF